MERKIKNHRFEIRLDDDEKKLLDELSKKNKLTKSDTIFLALKCLKSYQNRGQNF